MDRRAFIAAAGVLTVSNALSRSIAHAEDPKKPAAINPAASASPQLSAIASATTECLKACNACLAHCTEALAAGKKSMAVCQRAVMNVIAACEATSKVAAYHSADPKHIKALVSACADLCRACAKACEPHLAMAECKACHDACVACASACDAYVV